MGLLAVGLLLFILYVLALSVILITMPYALVVQGLGPMRAVLASINFFRYNKFDVVILWLVVAALSLGLQMIGGTFSTGRAGRRRARLSDHRDSEPAGFSAAIQSLVDKALYE